MKSKYPAVLLLLCTALFGKAQTKSAWSGSGILLSPDGYIAINNHTLEEGYHFGNLIGILNSGIKSGQPVGYAIKVSCLSNLVDVIPKIPPLPSKSIISSLSFPEKVTSLTRFIAAVRVSNQKLAAANTSASS